MEDLGVPMRDAPRRGQLIHDELVVLGRCVRDADLSFIDRSLVSSPS